MKVSLVVASGAHKDRVIPITGPQFVIGRDTTCHLRPASQAISKRHCGVLVRDGQIYIADYGSTNGTMVNGELVRGAEVAIESGATLQLGPLDFIVRVEVTVVQDGTPLPGDTPESAAALAAVKAASGVVARSTSTRDTTPNPAKPAPQSGSKDAPALTGSKEAAALKAAAAKPVAKPAPQPAAKPVAKPAEPQAAGLTAADDDHDRMAAMLLGMDDEGTGEVPDGSTVMDMPVPDTPGADAGKADEKKKKDDTSREDMSNAATEILRKMMRRPK